MNMLGLFSVAERETSHPASWGVLVRGCSKNPLTGFALVLGEFDVSSWKWRLALGWVFCSCQKQGYYKQCCDEHWGTRVSFPSGFLSVYAQQWDCWIIRQFYFQFFKESPHSSP